MSKSDPEELKKWYELHRPTYELLSTAVETMLESLIKNAGIDYLYITGRTKKVDSFSEKISRKKYINPSQEITDLAGIRVITYIEADALKVNDLIKSSFNVNSDQSLDKSDELGIDKFGYRSFHFVCDLGDRRVTLPEYSLFKSLLFEIQVRTVLQHAWAEIEHDRNYKFAGILPDPIKRRLHLLAGLLELADGEFNKISKDIDIYSDRISEETKTGNLDLDLNSITLDEYFENSEIIGEVYDAAENAGFYIDGHNDYISLINICNHLKIFKIENIDLILENSKHWMREFLLETRKSNNAPVWYAPLSFFVLLIIAAAHIKSFTKDYFAKLGWSSGVIDSVFYSADINNTNT